MKQNEEQARERLGNLASRLNLDPDSGDIVLMCTEEGEWVIVITRNGYRKALVEQPDYKRHCIYPIYNNTVVDIVDNSVSVHITGAMHNLIGAIGVLYKHNLDGPFIWQVTLDDYLHLNHKSWTEMKHTMLVKVCEVGLIRMAYPELFAGTYSDSEYWGDREDGNYKSPETKKTLTKAEAIRYIRENASIVEDLIREKGVKVDSLAADEINALVEEINMRNGDGSNSQNK